MLPVPYDRPLTPIYTYNYNQPPAVPNTAQLHPSAQAGLVMLSAIAANEISQKAGNSPTMMFCYNILSSNNWNNQFFAEYVKMIADYSVYKQQLGQVSNPVVGYETVALELTPLFASFIASQYPIFVQMLPATTQNAIDTNVQIYFRDVKPKCDSIYYANQVHQPQQYGYQNNQLTPQRGQQYAQHMAHNVRQSSANPAIGGMHAAAMNQGPRNTIAQTKFSVPNRAVAQPVIETEPVRSAQPVSGSRPVPSNLQSQQPTNNSSVKITGEIEMDREKHALAYRGENFSLPKTVSGPKQDFEQAIQKVTASNSDETKVNSEVVQITDTTIESALLSIQAKFASKITRKIEVFPTITTIHHALVASCTIGDVMTKLLEVSSFAGLSEVLGDYLKAANINPNKDEGYHRLVWLMKFDRELTSYLNDYFKYGLCAGTISIDSFIDDVDGLAHYVNKRSAGNDTAVFNRFQRAMMSSLIPKDKLILPDLEESENAPPDYEVITFKYGVYYITATSKTLGYNVKKKSSAVSSTESPMLHRLLTELNKISIAGAASKQYLMTLDGVLYGFYEVPSMNEFNLYEA